MSRDLLGIAAFVVLSAAFAACTVNFEGKRFCKPHCTGVGGGDTGSGGSGGFTETFASASSTGGSGGTSSQGGGGGCGGKAGKPKSDFLNGDDMPPAAFWTELFPKRSVPAMVEKGVLLITPTPMATWDTGSGACPSDGCGAPAIVQRVSGNFTMKTHVALTVTGQADPFAAAGILLAEPCDAAKNNVVWDLGYQNNASMGTDLSQTSDGGPATQEIQGTTFVEADLYACRIDDQFYFYVGKVAGVSPPAGSPDGTLQWNVGDLDVGLTAHVNGPKPVIEAQFHGVTFANAVSQDDCTTAL